MHAGQYTERCPYSSDVVDNQGHRFMADIRHRPEDGRQSSSAAIGRRLRLSATPRCYGAGHGRGIGTIVDTDAAKYKVHWRNPGVALRAREFLCTVPPCGTVVLPNIDRAPLSDYDGDLHHREAR